VDSDTVSRLGGALDWYIIKCALIYITYIPVEHSRLTICRSLLRDNKHAVEKEQVVKLIRTIVELSTVRPDSPESSGSVQLSEAVVRSVIAVAEHAEDPFRLVCIQTLTEIRAFYLTLILNTFS
jgi:rapamycin-insensitive companion of mTOR